MEEEYNYSRIGDVIEITIKDGSHRKLDFFKCNLADKKLVNKIFEIIRNKYGLVMNVEDIINNQKLFDKDKDLF